MRKFTNNKIILAGNIVEVYEYENAVMYNFDAKRSVSQLEPVSLSQKESSKKRSLSRTRSTVRHIINANANQWLDSCGVRVCPKFITLTFGDNVSDLSVANDIFTNFVKRLNYGLEQPIRYTAVPEFQQRGAVHYHIVIYNQQWIDSAMLAEVWGAGFVKINAVDNVVNLGLYMTKYMTKDTVDPRLDGKKRYFCSRSLLFPQQIRNQKLALDLLPGVEKLQLLHERSFETEYQGWTTMRVYFLPDSHPLRNMMQRI